jgi:hypothetical protein
MPVYMDRHYVVSKEKQIRISESEIQNKLK